MMLYCQHYKTGHCYGTLLLCAQCCFSSLLCTLLLLLIFSFLSWKLECCVKLIMLQVLHGASGMYRNLNSLAMQLTKKGGLLMTCSCSGAVTQSGIFLRILQVLYVLTEIYHPCSILLYKEFLTSHKFNNHPSCPCYCK